MGEGIVDIQPGKGKSCLKEGGIVMWKRQGVGLNERGFSLVFLLANHALGGVYQIPGVAVWA